MGAEGANWADFTVLIRMAVAQRADKLARNLNMQAQPHILVVDDDVGITTLLCSYLSRFGLQVHAVADGVQMRQHLDTHPVDLVVLDLMLPGVDGLTLARALRAGSRIPIIMLTAHSSAADRIVGLEIGADDYMGKPFEPRELVARIQSVLRRAASPGQAAQVASDVIAFDGWRLQRNERLLTSPKGLVVPLSNAEFQLLMAFLKAPRRVVTREQLAEQARGRTLDDLSRSIDLLVSRLRQKLTHGPQGSGDTHAAGPPALIKTVRGAGYMFNARSVQGQVSWEH
jgi:two-component system OmpR family response regulator